MSALIHIFETDCSSLGKRAHRLTASKPMAWWVFYTARTVFDVDLQASPRRTMLAQEKRKEQ